MQGLDPAQCEAFLAVVEGGSFEAAAQRLHLTSSAISQRVRALELQLGGALLERTRPCRPTRLGQRLQQYLGRARLLLDDFMGEGNSADAPLTLTIAVNADTLGTWFLPAIAPLLQRESLLVDLLIEDQDHTYALLESGHAQACISTEARAMRGCVAEQLGVMRYRLLATPAYLARWFPRGFTRDAARVAPVLVFNRKDALQAEFLLRNLGLPEGSYPCHYIGATEPFLSAIRLGLAYGMVPELQAQPFIDRGEVCEVLPDHPVDVPLYWHHWKVQSARMEAFSQQLQHAARQALAGAGD